MNIPVQKFIIIIIIICTNSNQLNGANFIYKPSSLNQVITCGSV